MVFKKLFNTILIIIFLFLILPSVGWGSFYKDIVISGTGSDETNYIVPLNIHYGSQVGDVTTTDIFLESKSKTDFGDVRFKISGVEIPYYIHSYGNYEILSSSTNTATVSRALADGTIIGSDAGGEASPLGQGLWKSVNNGSSWSNIYNATEAKIIFVDSQGNKFASTSLSTSTGTHLIIRSAYTDTAHTTWSTVLDLSSVNGIGIHSSMCEDSSGNLYFGRYQDSTSVVIYKSTDHGVNWSSVYAQTTQQHVHGLYCDTNQTPNAIYAGLDGNPNLMIKSTDAGGTWGAVSGTPTDSAFNQMVAGSGFRVYSGEASVKGGYSIFRTTDDTTWSSVLSTAQTISGMQIINGNIYAFGATNGLNKYAQIFRSTDNGATWKTIKSDTYFLSSSTSAGWRYATPPMTPTSSSEAYIPVGALDTRYKNTRIYDGGATHYQALVYVKIPSLPAAGTTIRVTYGNSSLTTTSTNTIFTNSGNELTQSNLVAWYKLDEGSGTTIADSSGLSHSATLSTATSSWNAANGRRSGWAQPSIQQTGDSIHFNGDRYVEITNSHTDPHLQFTKNFTLIAWIKTDDTSSTLRQIVGKNGLATPDPIGLYIRNNGTLAFYYGNGSAYTNKSSDIVNSSINLYDGQWHMVAVTISNDATPTALFTVDGVSGSASALSYEPTNGTSGRWRIGANIDNNQYFLGSIDDVQIYNVALTATQVRQIYENRAFSATEPEVSSSGSIRTMAIGGGSLGNNMFMCQ